jgi:hypothetical protein
MPHFPKPFYRAPRNTWFVELDKKQHPLGKHPEALPPPVKHSGDGHPIPREIWEAYQLLIQNGPPSNAATPSSIPPLVVAVLDAYLDWLDKRVEEGTKARRTYDWYRKYLSSFASFRGEGYCIADLTVEQLQPIHVYQWADANPGWKTGKRGAMTAVQRAFNWAAKAGLFKATGGKSPLTALENPHRADGNSWSLPTSTTRCSPASATPSSAICLPPRGRRGRGRTSCSPSRRPSSTSPTPAGSSPSA